MVAALAHEGLPVGWPTAPTDLPHMRIRLLLVLAVVTASGCGVSVAPVAYDEKAPEGVADRFVQDLQDGRSSEAYDLLTPARQAEKPRPFFVGSPGVQALVAGPDNITAHRVLGSRFMSPRPLTVSVTVRVEHQGTAPTDFGLVLVRTTEDGWRVDLGTGPGNDDGASVPTPGPGPGT